MIQATNSLLISLYSFAYKTQIRLSPSNYANRILINSREKGLFKYNVTGKEYTESSYCYELILPLMDSLYKETTYLEYMQKDLDRYFKIKTSVAKRSIPCYILEPIEKDWIKNEKAGFIKEDSVYIELNNQPPQKIISILSIYCNFLHPPFYEGSPELRLSIKIKKETIDVAELPKILLSSGLKISIQNREIDMFCVSDQ